MTENDPPIRAPSMMFVGRAGSGKTTCAEFLEQVQHYRRLSFATPLKEMAVTLWGPDAMKDRGKLQKFGQLVRELDPDAWANVALRYMEARQPAAAPGPWVIDDCRFPNEFMMLKGLGFVSVRMLTDRVTQISRLTHIGKLQSEDQLDDISETALDGVATDYTIHNEGSMDRVGVYEQVADILLKELRR